MRVGRFLALFVRSDSALIFHERGVFTQLAIRQNREDRNRARTVVRNEQVLAGFVERHVARVLAECRPLIQQGELSTGSVHSKSAHGARLACLRTPGIGPWPQPSRKSASMKKPAAAPPAQLERR